LLSKPSLSAFSIGGSQTVGCHGVWTFIYGTGIGTRFWLGYGNWNRNIGLFRKHCISKHWVGVLRFQACVFSCYIYSRSIPLYVQQRRTKMLMSLDRNQIDHCFKSFPRIAFGCLEAKNHRRQRNTGASLAASHGLCVDLLSSNLCVKRRLFCKMSLYPTA
jgi:hypothetical protein